jgi:hypothetical protein
MVPPYIPDVLGRHRNNQIRIGDVHVVELVAPVVPRLDFESDESRPRTPAHRLVLDDVCSSRGHSKLERSRLHKTRRHQRTRCVTGAEHHDERQRVRLFGHAYLTFVVFATGQ